MAVTYTKLRDNMKCYMDKVTDGYETIIVTGKDNRNVVMLSEESYKDGLLTFVCFFISQISYSYNFDYLDSIGWHGYYYLLYKPDYLDCAG